MSKTRKAAPIKNRSDMAQAAWAHGGAGSHRDRRREGREGRSASRRRAIAESRG